MSPPTRPALARGTRLRWDTVRQRHFLLFPEGALALNASAAAVLELCNGKRSIDDIVHELDRRFPGAELAADVDDLLDQVTALGLVRDADA
ncbi:MAG: pyrroloquinoline quinone biosynthesis peptide chaperone PqqD [Actinomycetota bacterium]|nr:pyrroloquinoline quinone biosynthesis peptide chaperone PqqD [Actinomycetota bacterium]